MTALVTKQKESNPLVQSNVSAIENLNVVDAIDRILDKGIVINGEITVLLVGTEVLSLRVNLVIASIETAKRYGIELPWEKWQRERELKESLDTNKKDKVIPLNKKKKIGKHFE